MELNSIDVEWQPAAEGGATPVRLRFAGAWVEIEEIVDRWYQVVSLPEWPRATYYKVRGVDQREYLLKLDEESSEWFLGRRW